MFGYKQPKYQNTLQCLDSQYKNFFYLLTDMSKYILGSLATLLAIKGKDVLNDMTKNPEPTQDQDTQVVVNVDTDVENKAESNATNKPTTN